MNHDELALLAAAAQYPDSAPAELARIATQLYRAPAFDEAVALNTLNKLRRLGYTFRTDSYGIRLTAAGQQRLRAGVRVMSSLIERVSVSLAGGLE